MLLLSIYISIAIGISFICSVLEAVLLSISPSYIAQLNQQGILLLSSYLNSSPTSTAH